MASNKINRCFGYLILCIQAGFVYMGAPLPKFNAQTCNALTLDDCFKDLQVFLRLKSLPFTSDPEELDKLCDQSIAGYNCSAVLWQNSDCLSSKNKYLLPVFISMAEYNHHMLCGGGKDKGYLRPAFLEHSECVLKHTEEMGCCGRESHVTDLPVLQVIEESNKRLPGGDVSTCCQFSSYLQCALNTIEECGERAMNFTHEYIRRAAGEEIQKVCQDLPNYPYLDDNTCPEPFPTCSGSSTFAVKSYLYIFVFAVIFFGVRVK